MLIAPTEPVALKGLGKVSSIPEKHGVDVLMATRLGLVGVQRKEMADFFSSVHDGRLAREYPLMQTLEIGVLLLEGPKRWSTEGLWLGDPHSRRQWTRDQFRSYIMSVQSKGIWIAETDSLRDTVTWIEGFHKWCSKDGHSSLATRPKPQGAWGKPESRDWNLFLAQSFPGIGVVQAEKLIDHFGGQLPIAWTCTREELAAAPGIGKTRLETLWSALPQPTEVESAT